MHKTKVSRAVALIKVEYEVLPAITDVRDAVKPDAVTIHDEDKPYEAADGETLANTLRSTDLVVGNVAEGFDQSDYILEDIARYSSSPHQSYIDQVAIAASPAAR